jgi:LysE type translocator
MTTEQAIAFFLFAIVAAITPGPSNLILTSTGANVGVLRGLPCLCGVACGMGLMMCLVAFGLGSLVLERPLILHGLKWCGMGFLLWLSKRPTSGTPPSASISPPMAGPPNPPIWLLMAKNPVAVVREPPARSSNNVGVTADDILASAAAPKTRATVAHGDTCAVKTRAARSPLPQHDMANKAKRRRWSAARAPRKPPTIAPTPAKTRGRAVSPAGRW